MKQNNLEEKMKKWKAIISNKDFGELQSFW